MQMLEKEIIQENGFRNVRKNGQIAGFRGYQPQPGRRDVSRPDPEQNDSWRRLSPRMLLVHPVRELGQAIPALVGVVLAGRAMGDAQTWWLGPAGVGVVVAVSVLRWMTTRYRIN